MWLGFIDIEMETLVALGTLVLAAFTGYLAWSTRQLAEAATADQRAQWRPVLIAEDDEVDEHIEGELRVRLHNVGRGPALGVHGQLRSGGPKGATFPGSPDRVLPGEVLELRFSRKNDITRGAILSFEIFYYDIGDWLHATELTVLPREQQDGSKPLRVARCQVSESGTRRAFPKGSVHAARLVHPQPKRLRLKFRLKRSFKRFKDQRLRRLIR